ncbi:hypothetical protein ScalyP_jg4689 [Parmales sp. scaly parma]|nr:hypothetical protein ScalyP_jg4689 [Parmales sp. scaly parma]
MILLRPILFTRTSSSWTTRSPSLFRLKSTSAFIPGAAAPFSDRVFSDVDPTAPIFQAIEGSVVITGANRGIGCQLATLLSSNPKVHIFAGIRDFTSPSVELLSLPNTTILPLDLSCATSIKCFASIINEHTNKDDKPLNYLFNVAGILNQEEGKSGGGPERSILNLDEEWIAKTFAVNTMAPMLLTSALAPSLMSKVGGTKPPTIVNVSARVGSIQDNNSLGGWYSYRCSKSALNQFTRTLGIEMSRGGRWKRKGCAISFHPGTTETDLSQPFNKSLRNTNKLFPPQFVAQQLVGLVERVEVGKNSGGFYGWDWKAIPF